MVKTPALIAVSVGLLPGHGTGHMAKKKKSVYIN